MRLSNSLQPFRTILTLLVFALFTGTAAYAQDSNKPENLQVLPKSIEHDKLIEIMQGFTHALGVSCDHCHAKNPDNPGRLDFASDDKETKSVARTMMHMTETINKRLLPQTGRSELLPVQCITCHHGLTKPRTLQHELRTAFDDGGIDAAVLHYKKVRDKYYGLGAFDFGESALILTAQDFEKSNQLDAAEKFLKMNLDYFPKSANTYAQLAVLSDKKGNRKQAMDYFDKALRIEPNNNRIRYMINQMKQKNSD